MIKGHLRLFTAIVISILIALYFLHDRYLSGTQRPDALSARVVEVHDGDTVSVIIGKKKERVRLIGIDAPELSQRPWGARAKKHLKELLNLSGWRVTLEFDVEERDKYGRLLAYLWTTDERGHPKKPQDFLGPPVLINLEMLKDGYAVLFTFPPNVKYVDALRDGQRLGREKGLGIWGKKGLKEMPEDYRRQHPR